MLMTGLPYAAMALFIAGIIWRFRAPMTITARSSQILESRWLAFGAVPFHAGVITLFAGHLVPLLIPAQWQAFVSHRAALLTVETAGTAAALSCLAGLIILLLRRIALRPPSPLLDFVVLAILVAQVAVGLAIATLHGWGAIWSATTTTPYLRSIVALQPDAAFVAGAPALVTLHIAGAWIVLALIPFTRLVHMFLLPLGYIVRPMQKWSGWRRNVEARLSQRQTTGGELVRSSGDVVVERHPRRSSAGCRRRDTAPSTPARCCRGRGCASAPPAAFHHRRFGRMLFTRRGEQPVRPRVGCKLTPSDDDSSAGVQTPGKLRRGMLNVWMLLSSRT